MIQSFGISDYGGIWGDLQNARRDAEEVERFFRERLGFEVIREIPPETETTRQNILDLISKDLRLELTPADTAVFFYAGHGVRRVNKTYLVPSDARDRNDVDALLPLDEFLSAIDSLPAQRVMVIIDSCKSGLEIRSSVKRDQANSGRGSRARILLTSASGGQNARDGGGPLWLFTGHLVKALSSEDCDDELEQVCTSSQLIRVVAEAVSKASNGVQTPGWGRFGDDQSGEIRFTLRYSDDGLWREVSASPEEEGFLRYLRRYPNGRHAREARQSVRTLRADQLRGDELVTGDIAAYRGLRPGNIVIHSTSGMEYSWIQSVERQTGPSVQRGFWIGRSEVTVGAFSKFVPLKMIPAPGFNRRWKFKEQPIVNASWQIAQQYCQSVGGRLPTEFEWERAACTGSDGRIRRYPWGDSYGRGDGEEPDLYLANLAGGGDGQIWISPVGHFPHQNRFGLLDVLGNAAEWVTHVPGPGSSTSEYAGKRKGGYALDSRSPNI